MPFLCSKTSFCVQKFVIFQKFYTTFGRSWTHIYHENIRDLLAFGLSANGKSILLEVMNRLLGFDYATSVLINLFNEHSIHYKSGATPERDKLIGKRFAPINEMKQEKY